MSNTGSVSLRRLLQCYGMARDALLAERNQAGYWIGELSSSALATATAVMALEMVRRGREGLRMTRCHGCPDDPLSRVPRLRIAAQNVNPQSSIRNPLIAGGLAWLADHQNDDGGWGDTTKSLSNVSTAMLANAAFHATGTAEEYGTALQASEGYIDRAGGVQAVLQRYGKDRTFSVPILTHCALAGRVDWRDVLPLPFELACLPARFYKTVRLPVVSYALPALIAIGEVRHHYRKTPNPLRRLLRRLAIRPSLQVLDRIQPANGGFLEATPLTSFVTMSLAGMGLWDHPVARRGVQFITDSVRDDGSWPIDTNLATWVTTLSVNSLGEDLPAEDRPPIREWLLNQQYRNVHPYTHADPGGWAWTDLPGGVPDADDTAGAMLALLNLRCSTDGMPAELDREALANAVKWLLDVQNRDGGWPTFCRGWGTLPFDRSAADISAHVIRALLAWLAHVPAPETRLFEKAGFLQRPDERLLRRADRAVQTGFEYLADAQQADGSWWPLWFGNQFRGDESNPTYGTSRVLAAYRDAGRLNSLPAGRGLQWLRDNQNADGGWGGALGIESRVEETALAAESVISADWNSEAACCALTWLMDAVEDGTFQETTPIGFYFAKLWYFEKLYPLSFVVAALRRAVRTAENRVETGTPQQHREERQRHAVSD